MCKEVFFFVVVVKLQVTDIDYLLILWRRVVEYGFMQECSEKKRWQTKKNWAFSVLLERWLLVKEKKKANKIKSILCMRSDGWNEKMPILHDFIVDFFFFYIRQWISFISFRFDILACRCKMQWAALLFFFSIRHLSLLLFLCQCARALFSIVDSQFVILFHFQR